MSKLDRMPSLGNMSLALLPGLKSLGSTMHLNSNTHGSSKMPDPIFLGATTC
jgi:hypothetical protein